MKAAYYRNEMRLKHAAGMLGIHGLMQSQVELTKNREAESRAVREKVWGSKEGEQKDQQKDDEMGHMVLGDYQPQQHVHHHGSGALAKLAMAGVAAAGIGVPIAGAMALPSILDAMKPTPVIPAPAAPEPGTNTIEGWKIGEPIVE